MRTIFINGTVGVGKTTTATALGELLRRAEVPGALIDLDQLSECWPAPDDDRFNSRVVFANLRCVAGNVAAAGAEVLVAAGVIERPAGLKQLAEAVGGPIELIWLRAGLDLVRDRIRARHHDDPAGRDWHLARAGELDAIIGRSGLDQLTVDVTHLTPAQTAQHLAERLGLRSPHARRVWQQ